MLKETNFFRILRNYRLKKHYLKQFSSITNAYESNLGFVDSRGFCGKSSGNLIKNSPKITKY